MYAKIFRQIYDSSIAENPEVRFTFMDMLVLADQDGVVDMTHEAISRTTNRPLAVIQETIAVLEGPDPQSRTPDESGARLKRLDEHRNWGWLIINYDRFRATATEEQKREQTRVRVARYRENLREKANVTHSNAPVTHSNAPVTHSNAHVTPPSAYVCVSGSALKGNGDTGKGVQEFLGRLADVYQRPKDQRWTYEEEQAAAAVCRYARAHDDLTLILRWRSTIPPADRRYFPQSVSTLLQKWDEVLDRARAGITVGEPKKPSMLDRELDRMIQESERLQ